MKNRYKVINYYRTTLNSTIDNISESGSFNILDKTLNWYSLVDWEYNFFLTISLNDDWKVEIFRIYKVIWTEVFFDKRISPVWKQEHTSWDLVTMNDMWEVLNYIFNNTDDFWFVEQVWTSWLTVKAFWWNVYVDWVAATIADAEITIADNATNNIYVNLDTNVLTSKITNLELNEKVLAEVVTSWWEITNIEDKRWTDIFKYYSSDIMEFSTFTTFPEVWAVWKIFIAIDENKQYRWDWSDYVELRSLPAWIVPLSGYAATNYTEDRTYDADNTSLDEISDVIWTLLNDVENWLRWPRWVWVPTWGTAWQVLSKIDWEDWNTEWINYIDNKFETRICWEAISEWDCVYKTSKNDIVQSVSDSSHTMWTYDSTVTVWQTFTVWSENVFVNWISLWLSHMWDRNWNLTFTLFESDKTTVIVTKVNSPYSVMDNWWSKIFFDSIELVAWQEYFFSIGVWSSSYNDAVYVWYNSTDVLSWWEMFSNDWVWWWWVTQTWDLKFEMINAKYNFVNKTDASDENKLKFYWIATESKDIDEEIIIQKNGYNFNIINSNVWKDLYLSDTPWQVNLEWWTYKKEIWTVVYENNILIKERILESGFKSNSHNSDGWWYQVKIEHGFKKKPKYIKFHSWASAWQYKEWVNECVYAKGKSWYCFKDNSSNYWTVIETTEDYFTMALYNNYNGWYCMWEILD